MAVSIDPSCRTVFPPTLKRCPQKPSSISFFFLKDTAPTEIYPLSLHDALPISFGWRGETGRQQDRLSRAAHEIEQLPVADLDRKSTRLNSRHGRISHAVSL